MAEIVDRIQVQETLRGESARISPKRKFRWWESVEGTVASEFLAETSLHGLKYIGQPKRHGLERVFWIVTFIVGLAAAGFLIYGVFNRYEETPVVVSFQSKEQPVDTIPFPAVTFCYSHQFSKKQVESLKRNPRYVIPATSIHTKFKSIDGLKQGDPKYDAVSEMLSKIESMCLSRNSLFGAYFASSVTHINPRGDYYYHKNQTQYQQEVIDLLLEYTPDCSDMISPVMLDGSPVEFFSSLFNPVITEYGKCCTFNMLPTPLMLKPPITFDVKFVQGSVGNGNKGDIFDNPVLGTRGKLWWQDTGIDDWQKWSYEKGFILSPESYESRIIPNHLMLSHPFRNQRLGHRFGLSVMLSTSEPYCDKVTFRGTTFMLHNPVDHPRVSQFPSVIGLDQEAFIKIHPDITLADPDIKDLTIEKRQCFFGNEKVLKYFNPYTQENCFEECIADLIEKKCRCCMFYMPRPNGTILCRLDGKLTEGNCVVNTLSLLSKKEICGHCLPLCEYVDYNFEMTTAKILSWKNPYFTLDYDVFGNSSIAHIFYESPSTVPKLRKRLYGITDLIANTGGILGLCLGFSVLSGAEVLYYVLMRTIWQMLSRRYQRGSTKVDLASNTIGTMELRNPTDLNPCRKDNKSKLTKVFSKFGCKKKSLSFRCKWLYCIIVGSTASGLLVYLLLFRNEDNLNKKDTFKVTMDTTLQWWEATFCYINQFPMEKVLEFRRIANSTTDENLRQSAETNLSIIDAMCNYKDTLETSSSSKFPPIHPDVSNHTFLIKFLKENTISCNQMFPACVHMGSVQKNCSKIVTTIFTVHGKCCTISMIPVRPENVILEDNTSNITIENSSLFHKPDFNSSHLEVFGMDPLKEFPIHKPPSHFSLLLNLNEEAYLCHNSSATTNQILFTLHSPGKRPQVEDFSSFHVANEEIIITVFPETVYIDGRDKTINKGEKNCDAHIWPSMSRRGSTGFETTRAAYFDGCTGWFLASNCRCAFFGDERARGSPFCRNERNSNDSICLRKMLDLVNEAKSLCSTAEPRCRGKDYLYKTVNQTMENAENLWASLIKFGNDTSGSIPWANNKTGIIHFACNKSGQTPKSINNEEGLQNSIANGGGLLALMLITAMLSLICISLIVFPPLWRCISGLMVKCTLYFQGLLHARKE